MFAAGAGARYRGEASVSYLWDESSPAAIKRAHSDARILISLREPVDRAFSHYWLYVQLGLEHRSFRIAVEEELERNGRPAAVPPPYVARGLYAEQVARYLDAFDDVHVLFFDDLVADARQTMREIFAWLGVEASPADELDVVAHNAFWVGRNRTARWAAELVRRYRLARYVPFRMRLALVAAMTKPHPKPELEPETDALLRQFYAEPNRRLRELLGASLPWDAAA
jgi:hypothetical protein